MTRFRLLGALVLSATLAACGGGGSGDVGLAGGAAAGAAATPTFAYVANQDGTISTYTVDPATGNLSFRGYDPVPGTFALYDVARHPSGRYLYAVSGSRVYAFWIDPASGALEAINDMAGSGNNAVTLAMNAAGSVIYVADRAADTIDIYSVDPATGALGGMGSVNTGQNPYDLALHPGGALLYSVNRDDNDVTVFPIQADGRLGASSTAWSDSAGTLDNLTFTPDGAYAYLGIGTSSGNLKRFSVESASGRLTFVETVTAGNRIAAFELNAAGTYAYAASAGSDRVEVYSVAGDGALTSVQSINAGDEPDNLAFGPGGNTLYVGNRSTHEVSVFGVDPGGRLTLVDHVRTRDDVWAVAIKEGSGTPPASELRLHVPHSGEERLYSYGVNPADGTLGAPDTRDLGVGPAQIVFHPGGLYAYVVHAEENTVRAYEVDPVSGAFSTNGIYVVSAADAVLKRIAIDPSGRFLYVLDNRTDLRLNGRIFLFDIQADGRLVYNNAVNGSSGIHSGGPAPEAFIVHPGGRYLYVLNSFGDAQTPGDNIALFEIDEEDGDLTQRTRFTNLDRPVHAAIHPNGRWLYVTIQNEAAVAKYYMADSNGFLTSRGYHRQASLPPSETNIVEVHPSGDYAYVTAADGTLSWYSINRSNGDLTYRGLANLGDRALWMALTPGGRFAYVLTSAGIQRLSIDTGNGVPTLVGRTDLAGSASSRRSMTLD